MDLCKRHKFMYKSYIYLLSSLYFKDFRESSQSQTAWANTLIKFAIFLFKKKKIEKDYGNCVDEIAVPF